jgi:hypothetical protein
MTVRLYTGGASVQVIDEAPVVPPVTARDTVLPPPVSYGHVQPIGPADRAFRRDIEAAIAQTPKWDWFANAQLEYSPSRNGVPTTTWVRLPVWGDFSGVYHSMPRLMPDGTVKNVNSKAPGDDVTLNVVPYLKKYGMRPGPRGVAIPTPYTSYRAHSRKLPGGTLSTHPDIPRWIGVNMISDLVYLMADGEIRMPYRFTLTDEPHDWCPRTAPGSTADGTQKRKFMYIASRGNNRVVQAIRDGVNFTESVLFDIPAPTSVIATEDDTLYVVSNESSIWKFRLDVDTAPTKLCDLPRAFYLDYDSLGNIIVATLNTAVYSVNPTTGAVTLLLAQNNPQTWVTVSVDRNGTCGEKDNIAFCSMHMQNNAGIMVRKNGSWIPGISYFSYGNGQCTIGKAGNCVDLFGHYPWTAVYSQDSAEMLFEGASDVFPSTVVAHHAGMPVEDAYDHVSFTEGRRIIDEGCGRGTLVGSVPPLTAQMHWQGFSGIGVSADWICQWTFAEQAAFVQKGMLGGFPRPFIKGRDLYKALYFLGRSSLRGFKEGKPYFDGLKAFCTPLFGQELPAIAQPNIPNKDADTFVDAVVTGDTVTLKFMDKYNEVRTATAGAKFRVVVDEGFGDIDLGTLGAPFHWTLPALPAGQHAIRPLCVAGAPTTGKYSTRATAFVK